MLLAPLAGIGLVGALHIFLRKTSDRTLSQAKIGFQVVETVDVSA